MIGNGVLADAVENIVIDGVEKRSRCIGHHKMYVRSTHLQMTGQRLWKSTTNISYLSLSLITIIRKHTTDTHTHTHIIRKRCVQLSPTHFLIRNIIIFSIFTTSIVLHYEKFLSQYFLSIEKLMDFIWSTATTEKWCVMCYIFSFHLSAIFCVLSDKLLHTISWRRLWHLNCKWSWQS